MLARQALLLFKLYFFIFKELANRMALYLHISHPDLPLLYLCIKLNHGWEKWLNVIFQFEPKILPEKSLTDIVFL
jgi:hypothetical protein